ncbi:MAG TPA: glycosyltransferase family 4 protein [Candidatus Sulfotelmatobacter sp.]|nr:glycosyltransferase family 4 protein [Candidatus Sulfotelmatobacter sp.]
MAEQTRLLYLIGQFPAINHGYLLAEVMHLRRLGLDVLVSSISLPDRPPEKLSQQEREEAGRTYYVKSVPVLRVAVLNLSEFLRHPLRYLSGLTYALRLGRGGLRRRVHHLAYLAEAVLVGRYMRKLGLSHVHASFSATVALILTKIFPVTMSFGVYGFGELHDPSSSQLAERVKGALFVRSNSRHGRGQLMLSCDPTDWSRLIYVPLGINANEFLPSQHQENSGQVRLLCVGRLAAEKGQVFLLEAIAALRTEGRSILARLVGDGPDRKWLEKRADELGIGSNVEFPGWVDQERLLALYAESDLFVLPSLAEGIPMVLIEAMSMEIACIAPCIAGIPELIENGVDGMLFSVADVEDLTAKIRSLVNSPELRARMGEQARIRVMRDYDMARNSERFASALKRHLHS